MTPSGHLVISVLSAGQGEPLRQLHDELRRAGLDVEPAEAPAPAGAKSGTGTVASLLLTGLVSAAGLRALTQVLLAVIQRGEKRRIEIRRGDDAFILDAASARDGHAALEVWLRQTTAAAEIDEI